MIHGNRLKWAEQSMIIFPLKKNVVMIEESVLKIYSEFQREKGAPAADCKLSKKQFWDSLVNAYPLAFERLRRQYKITRSDGNAVPS